MTSLWTMPAASMATLGSSSWAPAGPCESGSNAFDFDGRLDEAIKAFTASHGRRPTYQEFKDALDPLEAKFDVGQISPRVFECAMMMTPMILFRGRYSHAIQTDVH